MVWPRALAVGARNTQRVLGGSDAAKTGVGAGSKVAGEGITEADEEAAVGFGASVGTFGGVGVDGGRIVGAGDGLALEFVQANIAVSNAVDRIRTA
jgi:hypothetical protein